MAPGFLDLPYELRTIIYKHVVPSCIFVEYPFHSHHSMMDDLEKLPYPAAQRTEPGQLYKAMNSLRLTNTQIDKELTRQLFSTAEVRLGVTDELLGFLAREKNSLRRKHGADDKQPRLLLYWLARFHNVLVMPIFCRNRKLQFGHLDILFRRLHEDHPDSPTNLTIVVSSSFEDLIRPSQPRKRLERLINAAVDLPNFHVTVVSDPPMGSPEDWTTLACASFKAFCEKIPNLLLVEHSAPYEYREMYDKDGVAAERFWLASFRRVVGTEEMFRTRWEERHVEFNRRLWAYEKLKAGQRSY